MMTEEKQDSIDRELTRAYFANTRKYGPLVAPEDKKVVPQKKFTLLFYFKTSVVAFLGIFVLLFVFSLAAKHFSFSIDISIKPAANGSGSFRLENPKTLYDFEKNSNAWGIPMWALDKNDHVGTYSRWAKNTASSGHSSIELYAKFPDDRRSVAIVEVQQYMNLNKYDTLLADVYIPQNAPNNFSGKLILTVGDNWKSVEAAHGTRLKKGKWNTIAANLNNNFREDVRKIAVRIESERKGAYSGPIYVDNIRVGNRAN